MSARQLIFDLETRPAFSREDFMVSLANARALEMLEGWENWPQKRCVLSGPAGAGKTHLAHVWANLSGARVVHAAEIVALAPADIDAPLVIDDADEIAGTPLEAGLFHLYNAMASGGVPLLLTAKAPPSEWGIKLPDLASRLATLPVAAMEGPDDPLLAALIVKQFADRQVRVDVKLVAFLLKRVERSFEAVRTLTDTLDRAAIAEKRPISIPFAKRILGTE